MKTYAQMTKEERSVEYAALQKEFHDWKARGLSLNMARGKPGKAQLDMVSDIFGLNAIIRFRVMLFFIVFHFSLFNFFTKRVYFLYTTFND